MTTAGTMTARIEFLAATRNEEGHITHQRGEVMQGTVISRIGDFLLLRTATGACLYVDASRQDLYCVELQEAGDMDSVPAVRIRNMGVSRLVVQQRP